MVDMKPDGACSLSQLADDDDDHEDYDDGHEDYDGDEDDGDEESSEKATRSTRSDSSETAVDGDTACGDMTMMRKRKRRILFTKHQTYELEKRYSFDLFSFKSNQRPKIL